MKQMKLPNKNLRGFLFFRGPAVLCLPPNTKSRKTAIQSLFYAISP
jgi:hypothetical protein